MTNLKYGIPINHVTSYILPGCVDVCMGLPLKKDNWSDNQ